MLKSLRERSQKRKKLLAQTVRHQSTHYYKYKYTHSKQSSIELANTFLFSYLLSLVFKMLKT